MKLGRHIFPTVESTQKPEVGTLMVTLMPMVIIIHIILTGHDLLHHHQETTIIMSHNLILRHEDRVNTIIITDPFIITVEDMAMQVHPQPHRKFIPLLINAP